jgi:chlorobactene glucosyltransferase
MIWIADLAALPWVALGAVVVFGIRKPRPLPSDEETIGAGGGRGLPSVRIVVPARNESRNIEGCVRSLAGQDYPGEFTIVVVDDGSTDGTSRIAGAVAANRAGGVYVLPGAALPSGWLGKPWACAQGAEGAREDVILFTDADTVHDSRLLHRTVTALVTDGADALTLIGRQELGSFWERLIQPQIFTVLGIRYRRLDRPVEKARWQDAFANGQYVLVRREAYEDVGGHAAVRSEVVEDLQLAQHLVRAGRRIIVRDAEDVFSTRMYQSLPEIMEGWTKNLAVGARQSGRGWGALALWGIVVYLGFAWVAPPVILGVVLAARLMGGDPNPFWLTWSAVVVAVGILVWADSYGRRWLVSPAYALLYPVGAAVTALIAVRSEVRGTGRIEWKGRLYSGGRAERETG